MSNKEEFLQRLQDEIDAEKAEQNRLTLMYEATHSLARQVAAWCENVDRMSVEQSSVTAAFGIELASFKVSFMNHEVSFGPSEDTYMGGWIGGGRVKGLRRGDVSLHLNAERQWILMYSEGGQQRRFDWSEETFFGMLTEAK